MRRVTLESMAVIGMIMFSLMPLFSIAINAHDDGDSNEENLEANCDFSSMVLDVMEDFLSGKPLSVDSFKLQVLL